MRLSLLFAAVAVLGCDLYEKPNHPVPKDFEARTLGGKTFYAADFKGKPWVVTVWVPGCHMCARELPVLEALRQEYEDDGLGFAALSLEPDEQLVIPALQAMRVEMKVLLAQDEVLGPFGVNQVPSTVFIDKRGIIVAAASGEKKRPFLERRIKELLAR
ncbi:MAG: TlpA family protein disulfide reductase [Myxococcota bacterium]